MCCIFQFEKDELLAKATKEKEESRDEKKERMKEQMDQERIERKAHLNAWKVMLHPGNQCWNIAF